jgi:pimeloyl-ACP methyl ester carboxylesterase
MSPKTVTSTDATTIAFDQFGAGAPIITAAGAFNDRSTTDPLARALAPQFMVVNYDRRGRGDSGDAPQYAVEREIEDLEALIAAVGGAAAVFGYSSGATLALRAAAAGLAITELALYEPPFVVDESRPRPPADLNQELAKLISADRRGDAVELFMTEAVGVSAETVAPMRGAPFWSAFEAVAHTLLYDDAIMGDTTSGAPLPAGRGAVNIPTLVVDGGASPAWARNAVAALEDVLPDAQRRTLEGQTHQVDPEMLAPVLGEFFS